MSHRVWPVLQAAPSLSDKKGCSSPRQLYDGLPQFLLSYLRALQAWLGKEQLFKNKKKKKSVYCLFSGLQGKV